MMGTTILLYVRQLQQLADEAPDKPMVICGQHITTRQEFLKKAQKVAVLIRERHQDDSAFFPIALPNSADYLAAELGVWMSGNASVHIGDTFPKERVSFIIADCKAPFVIDREFMLEAEAGVLSSDFLPSLSRTEAQPCAMFYTSGSTGTPKGVLHSDRSLMESIALAVKISSWSEDDTFGSLSPFYFMAICFVYEALYKGTCVDIISPEAASDIIALEHHLRSHHITTTFINPSVMRVLNVNGLSMRQIRVGGDRASLLSPRADCELCNCYGQTEMAGAPFRFRIDKAYDNTPVGQPTTGVEAVIVDEQGNPVADGQDGELCLKGITPPTYFGDREKTEALMRGGMFHTGDIFRRLPTGDYLYVNRNDWMVKINGQRVEPGEVEAVMRKVDGVAEAVVKGFSDNHGSKYLVGYYTVKTNSAVTSDDISNVLQKSLPTYMIPAFLVKFDAFQLNSHGKIDRMALTPPTSDSLQEDYVAPTNETEALLCKIFAEVLELRRVGIDDDFISMGGTSIQLMRIQQSCAESDMDVLRTIPARLIYQGRTPRGIAALLGKAKKYEKEQLDDYPLNGIQKSYFQVCQQHVGQPMFNVSNLIALHAATDMQRLALAIEKVVAVHPGLHAQLFENAEGEVRQKCVAEPYTVSVDRMTETAFEAKKSSLVQPFHLLAPTPDTRLFRFRLFETEKGKYMFYDIHHIVYDGASQTILFRDIERAYQGMTIEPEDWTLFDIAAEESDVRQTEALQLARDWYRATFADAIPLPRPDMAQDASPKLTSLTAILDVPLQKVEAACTAAGVTMNVLTTAAFALLLGKQAHTRDVVFASAYNAREDSRVRNSIGLFARPLFIRTRWTEHALTKDFLQHMRSNLLECMENSIYSYAEMQADIPLSPGYLFIYQGDLTAEPVIGGHPTQTVTIAEKQAISAIEAHLFLDSDEKHLKMEMLYKQAFYSEEYIKSMVTDYQTALNGLMTTMHLSDIEI